MSSTCFEHPSVHPQDDLYMQFYCMSFMHLYQTHPDIDQTAYWMHERNTIKLHVQVFLWMNTWMFETCRRHILIRSNEMQQYAGVYLLQNYSTCFGCLSHPSSGVHETVTAASGTDHSVRATTFRQRGL